MPDKKRIALFLDGTWNNVSAQHQRLAIEILVRQISRTARLLQRGRGNAVWCQGRSKTRPLGRSKSRPVDGSE